MASIVSLTLLLVLVKISSSANQKSLTSPGSTYVGIVASPSLAIWLGWIAIAFIFDANKYLLVKGKCVILSSFWKIKSFLTVISLFQAPGCNCCPRCTFSCIRLIGFASWGEILWKLSVKATPRSQYAPLIRNHVIAILTFCRNLSQITMGLFTIVAFLRDTTLSFLQPI